MGKIMRNGKKYSGASSSMAENIIYDNTESGLEANDVQGAVDELNTSINELNSNIDEQNDKFERRVGNIDGYLGDWSTIDFSRYSGRPSIRFIREDNGDTYEIRFTSTGIEFYTNGALVWSK